MNLLADGRIHRAGLVAVLVLVLDQASKAVVEHSLRLHQAIPVTSFFDLVYLRNPGAAFSLFQDLPAVVRLPLFLLVTLVVSTAIVSYVRSTPPERTWLVAALGGILGGAFGNLVCRMRYGAVVDFVYLHWGDWYWPAFNVADSAITVGAIVVVASLRGEPASRRADAAL